MNAKSNLIEKRVRKNISFLFGSLIHKGGRKNIFETGVGENIYFQSSVIHHYKAYSATWQAVEWDTLNQVDYICQIIEDKGFVLIPSEILRKMTQYVNCDKKRFFFSVKLNEGIELQTIRGMENISLKYYFHPINLDSYEEIMAA